MIDINLPDTDKNVVTILSGGLDSTILTHLLVKKYGNDRVFAISFYYNQKQSYELEMARETCLNLGIQHKLIDIGFVGDIVRPVSSNIKGSDIAVPGVKDIIGHPQPVSYIPFRNMLLNTIGFTFAESNNANLIFSGLQITDSYGYWDTTREFVDGMNNIASLNRKFGVELIAPFGTLTKAKEVAIAKELGIIDELKFTLTCYDPDDQGRSCGECASCSERIKAFKKNGIKDPIPYSIYVDWNISETV